MMAAPGRSDPGAAAGRVLLVEDDAPLRQMLGWELSDLGYAIGAAAGCAEARRLAGRRRFQYALIDVCLPDGDGRDLAAELRAAAPELRAVLMSGAHGRRPASLPNTGVLAFLAKPVDMGVIERLFRAGVADAGEAAAAR
jgi:DNA-binding NtrC family response regulator